MDESKIDDIPQVSMQGNESLVEPFIEEEVKKKVLQMEHTKVRDLMDFQLF
jgi:hypothetical protein